MTSTTNLYLPTDVECRLALALRDAAARLAEHFIRTLGPTRTGCCITVLNPRGDVILTQPFGAIHVEKEWRYLLFSREKPLRTLTHEGHVSSFESRLIDEANQVFQYGGGVRFLVATPWLGWGIGTSGFPEHVDECVSLGAGAVVGATTPDFIERVISVSANPEWFDTLRFIEQDPILQALRPR